MRFLVTITAALHILIMTPLCALGALVAVVCFDRRGVVWWPISRFWGLSILSFATTGVQVRGYENVSIERGAILMANHTSHLDPPLLIAVSKIPISFLTKRVLFFFPVFGWGMWAVGHIPIDRKNRDSAFNSLDKAAKVIVSGRLVSIFPEGTRSRTREMNSFKKGGFVIATKGKIPIIPVGIDGTQAVMPKGWCWMKRHPVKVVFGEPIDTSECTPDTKEELMTLVRERIELCRQEAIDWQEGA